MAGVKLFAREIVAYSDAELDRYLEENGRLIRVHDPNNLPESFIQRLRDRVHSASDSVSHAVDLDQVSAKLLQISSNKGPIHKHPFASESRTATPPDSPPLTAEEQYLADLEEEKESLARLVDDGGRPFYPAHLLEEVSSNPAKHHELLHYWQGEYPNPTTVDWMVFTQQWVRWRQFREWQGKLRGTLGVSKAASWNKKRLEKYSFSRAFELSEDPKNQDKLSTWIEYLAYEYMLYDRVAWYNRHEERYKNSWKRLVDSGVLRQHETEEFVLSIESMFQRSSEGTRLQQAVESARSALSLAEQAVCGKVSTSSPTHQRLARAKSRLDAALQSIDSFKRRNDCIIEFKNSTSRYRSAKHTAEFQIILVQWVRDQVPLIELELQQAQTAAAETAAESSASQFNRAKEEKHGKGEENGQQEEEQTTLVPQITTPGPQTRKRSRGHISPDECQPAFKAFES